MGVTLRHAESPSGPTPGELTKGFIARIGPETGTNPLITGKDPAGRPTRPAGLGAAGQAAAAEVVPRPASRRR